jgi:hypothetical protein
VLPDAGEQDTEAPVQLSVAVGAVYVTAPLHEIGATKLLGQPTRTGNVMSTAFTSNEHVEVLPFPSLAVSVTVVVPTPLTVLLAAGDWVTVITVAQLSLVVAIEV